MDASGSLASCVGQGVIVQVVRFVVRVGVAVCVSVSNQQRHELAEAAMEDLLEQCGLTAFRSVQQVDWQKLETHAARVASAVRKPPYRPVCLLAILGHSTRRSRRAANQPAGPPGTT